METYRYKHYSNKKKARCKYCDQVYTYFYGEAPGYCFKLDCIHKHIAEELAKLEIEEGAKTTS